MTVALTPGKGSPTHRRTVTATVAGNLVEHFDWLGFGLFAPLFATQFFPSHDPVVALLNTFAVFAAGMFFRPLGGILLGRYADRRGRKPAMMLAIVLMGGGSTLIGIAPTFEQIGMFAPLLLVIGRAAQGMSAGGEWTAAVTYLMELAPAARRCLYGSLFAMTAAGGVLLASLLGAGLSSTLTTTAMAEWGWRVPFILGGVFAVILMLLRKKLTETSVFERRVSKDDNRGSFRNLVRVHWRSLLLAAAFSGGTTWVSSTWTTVIPTLGARASSVNTMFLVVVLVTAIAVVIQIPLGLLADKIGVQPMLATFALGFAIVGPFAFLGLGSSYGSLVFSYGSGIMFVACLTSVMPKVMASMYPPEVRAFGIGLTTSIMTAVLGGISPWVATYLVSKGAGGWFVASAVVAVLIAWAAAATATRRFITPETKAARTTSTPTKGDDDTPEITQAAA